MKLEDPYLLSDELWAYLQDELPEEKLQEMETRISENPELKELIQEFSDSEQIGRQMEVWAMFNVEKGLMRLRKGKKKYPFYKWGKIAAITLLLIGLSVVTGHWAKQAFFIDQGKLAQTEQVGKGLVTWTTAAGKVFVLDSLSAQAKDSSEKILVVGDIAPVIGMLPEEEKMTCNRVDVPCGGTYILQLEDGSRVFLNSGSSLQFPVHFAEGERRVKISGEAFFEVAKVPGSQFVVEAGELAVKVLGTRFDVKHYPDEQLTYTTLVSGSVSVSGLTGTERKIVPGEQLLYDKHTGGMKIRNVDVELFTAWKDGMFYFKDEPLDEIMKILSRWYGLEVFYTSETVKTMVFSGKMKMYSSVDDVLRKFELSGQLDFELKGKSLTIYKK